MLAIPTMYYCSKCNKKHKTGKIYQAHLQFELKEDNIPYDKVVLHSDDDFKPERRELIKRQINRLHHKYRLNPSWRDVYVREINKVIMTERGDI